MGGEALGVVQPGRCVDQPAESGHESAAERRQTVLAQCSIVAAIPHVEAGLQDRLHLGGPRTVGMVFPKFLTASEEVRNAGLVHRAAVAAIRRPPVAHEHAGEVRGEDSDRIVEPAATANRVDGRFRGGEHPEPVAVGTDAPARLVRRDHGTVADLFAQRRVGRRGVAGGAVQHVCEAARRHVDAELRPQQVGDLRQRHTHLGVQLDDQGDDAGAELHAGGAQRVGGLQRVAALHTPLTLRAVADLDIKTTHEGAHLGQFFLILRRHAGHFDRAAAVRTGRRDRRPVGLVDLRRGAAAAPPAIGCAGSPAGTPAAPLPPVLSEGGGLAATRPARSRQPQRSPHFAI